ncbi:hypothetical protein BAC2_03538 [uncultured bacterium]|nr:hypothetical protein BAC2_03538 [uncultured bacterium]
MPVIVTHMVWIKAFPVIVNDSHHFVATSFDNDAGGFGVSMTEYIG